jgi:acetyltransferase-like isoleucine patch superfamily enzyme
MTEASIGKDSDISGDAVVGHSYNSDESPPHVGKAATVRSGTIIYCDVVIGDGFTTGHDALIREKTTIGDSVLVGTQTIIDGYSDVGSHVSLQSGVYIPSYTNIGDNVFIGPHAVLTNDPHPIRRDVDLDGPYIEDGASVGANATILPGISVGQNAFVAAGAVVTEDVPSDTLAVGAPARHRSLPPELEGGNEIR